MKIDDHKSALKEHEDNIRRCIESGVTENQRNIAFNISQASIEVFSIYMLKNDRITSSTNFDHRIFKKSSQISEKIPFDFPEKTKIPPIMRRIEEKRLLLCYGKRKPEKEIKDMINLWEELKAIAGDQNEKE